MKKIILFFAFCLISFTGFSQSAWYTKQLVTNVKFNPGVHYTMIDLQPVGPLSAHQDWHWAVTIKYTGHVSLTAGSYAKMQECGTDGNDWADYSCDTVLMAH